MFVAADGKMYDLYSTVDGYQAMEIKAETPSLLSKFTNGRSHMF